MGLRGDSQGDTSESHGFGRGRRSIRDPDQGGTQLAASQPRRPLHRRLASVRPSANNRRPGSSGMMIGVEDVPQVVADLTFTPVRGGRATVPPGCWEEDRPPVIGEDVLVADSGTGPFKATITSIEADGTLVLAVHAFVPAHA